MALNGSGTFSRLYSWVTDRNAGTKIQAARMDAEMDGMATALSTALYRDGQAVPTANLPMGGYKLTGLGDATAATDALNRQTADARYLASSTAVADLAALLDEAVHDVVDVASASTCDIGAATSDRVRITGTTTITSLGTGVKKIRFVHFSGALTLTHNATSLILPTGANITTAAGDCAIFSSDASGNWRCLDYQRADGVQVAYTPVNKTGDTMTGSLTIDGQLSGGLGALSTAGVANWNDTTNCRAGSGPTLLLGNATNGPGPVGQYFHALNFEYAGKNGTGEITQLAIPYASPLTTQSIWMRGRYNGSWSGWVRLFGSGDYSSGSPVRTVNGSGPDGAGNVTVSSGLSAASQAEQEAASSTSVAVTPGLQQYHPSAAKAWVKFNSAGSVLASYNITSVTDVTTGRWTVNIATDFSSASYVGVAMCGQTAAPDSLSVSVYNTPTAGTFTVQARDSGGTQADPVTPNEIHVAFFGDQ